MGVPRCSTAEGLAARIVAQAGSGAETTSEFRYGAGGRYLRIDQTGASTRTTRYLGSVEWITNSGSQRQELRRTIGGFLIISEERLTPGAASTKRKHQYLFHDHLGSVDVIVEAESLANGNQGVVDRKSYNAHGLAFIVEPARPG